MADRFFLFSRTDYYPSGGMQEYVGCFPTLEEAKLDYDHNKRGDVWAQIAVLDDSKGLKVIWTKVDQGPTVYCHDWRSSDG